MDYTVLRNVTSFLFTLDFKRGRQRRCFTTILEAVVDTMSQKWALSQTANKASGVCPVCKATRQLHLKDGTLHQHGPRTNRCPGTGQKPLSFLCDPITPAAFSPTVPSQACSQFPVATPIDYRTAVNSSVSHPPYWQRSIKHIPKAARFTCARTLTSVLSTVVAHPESAANWQAILDFGFDILRCPVRGGKRHNLSSTILKRCGGNASEGDFRPPTFQFMRRADDESLRAAAVTAKLEDGNISAAVRILCSDDSPADFSQETWLKLQDKHPNCSSTSALQISQSVGHPAYQTTEAVVMKMIRSFPAGSAAGSDGFRPQHLMELVQSSDAGSALLTAVTSFVNLLLDGSCHEDFRHVFFGGRLIALHKKSGGIRPIAIGCTWRRLSAKCANAFACEKLVSMFCPRQVGVAVKGGCEAAVHATRRYMDHMPLDHVVAKLDFYNAFNCMDRCYMLNQVAEVIPELYKFCCLSYGQSSTLQFGDYIISSEVGVQQGDPLGALLFCIGLHPILSATRSELTIGYMDDVTLGGSCADVAADVELFRSEGSNIGLVLNIDKCEVIARQSTSSATSVLSQFSRIDITDSCLLGAPLHVGQALTSALENKSEVLKKAVDRLRHIPAHDALILMRSSFSAPRLMHILRCSPCHGHSALAAFDNMLRNGVSSFTNSKLSDIQWTQACLPIRDGGLGIRRASSLALPAFLASAASTAALQESILGNQFVVPDSSVETARATWSSLYQTDPPVGLSVNRQRSWDAPVIQRDLMSVHDAASTAEDHARLLAIKSPHASDWLFALPISSCGLRLDDEAVRVAVGLRLGLQLCQTHRCPCGTTVDTRGLHGLSCRRSSGRAARHQQLNDLIYRAIRRADIPAAKEPAGLTRIDGKRPDGLTLTPWQGGRSLTWDVTVVDTFAASYLAVNSIAAGGACAAAVARKSAKYACLASTYYFVPIAVETLGTINSEALEFLVELGRRITAVSKDNRESSFLFQRLSVLIQRFNAVAFRGSFELDIDR